VIDSIVEEALRELADESFQRRVWLGQSAGEMSSFTECVAHLFDDSGLGDALEGAGIVYSESIDDLLRELDEVLGRVMGHSRSPEDVVGDPAMDQARSLARWILRDVRALE
jgi:hypothetical protein